jgi:hypothetical protein
VGEVPFQVRKPEEYGFSPDYEGFVVSQNIADAYQGDSDGDRMIAWAMSTIKAGKMMTSRALEEGSTEGAYLDRLERGYGALLGGKVHFKSMDEYLDAMTRLYDAHKKAGNPYGVMPTEVGKFSAGLREGNENYLGSFEQWQSSSPMSALERVVMEGEGISKQQMGFAYNRFRRNLKVVADRLGISEDHPVLQRMRYPAYQTALDKSVFSQGLRTLLAVGNTYSLGDEKIIDKLDPRMADPRRSGKMPFLGAGAPEALPAKIIESVLKAHEFRGGGMNKAWVQDVAGMLSGSKATRDLIAELIRNDSELGGVVSKIDKAGEGIEGAEARMGLEGEAQAAIEKSAYRLSREIYDQVYGKTAGSFMDDRGIVSTLLYSQVLERGNRKLMEEPDKLASANYAQLRQMMPSAVERLTSIGQQMRAHQGIVGGKSGLRTAEDFAVMMRQGMGGAMPGSAPDLLQMIARAGWHAEPQKTGARHTLQWISDEQIDLIESAKGSGIDAEGLAASVRAGNLKMVELMRSLNVGVMGERANRMVGGLPGGILQSPVGELMGDEGNARAIKNLIVQSVNRAFQSTKADEMFQVGEFAERFKQATGENMLDNLVGAMQGARGGGGQGGEPPAPPVAADMPESSSSRRQRADLRSLIALTRRPTASPTFHNIEDFREAVGQIEKGGLTPDRASLAAMLERGEIAEADVRGLGALSRGTGGYDTAIRTFGSLSRAGEDKLARRYMKLARQAGVLRSEHGGAFPEMMGKAIVGETDPGEMFHSMLTAYDEGTLGKAGVKAISQASGFKGVPGVVGTLDAMTAGGMGQEARQAYINTVSEKLHGASAQVQKFAEEIGVGVRNVKNFNDVMDRAQKSSDSLTRQEGQRQEANFRLMDQLSKAMGTDERQRAAFRTTAMGAYGPGPEGEVRADDLIKTVERYRTSGQQRYQEMLDRGETGQATRPLSMSRLFQGDLGQLGWGMFNLQRAWRMTGGVVQGGMEDYAKYAAGQQQSISQMGGTAGFTGPVADVIGQQNALKRAGLAMGKAGWDMFGWIPQLIGGMEADPNKPGGLAYMANAGLVLGGATVTTGLAGNLASNVLGAQGLGSALTKGAGFIGTRVLPAAMLGLGIEEVGRAFSAGQGNPYADDPGRFMRSGIAELRALPQTAFALATAPITSVFGDATQARYAQETRERYQREAGLSTEKSEAQRQYEKYTALGTGLESKVKTIDAGKGLEVYNAIAQMTGISDGSLENRVVEKLAEEIARQGAGEAQFKKAQMGVEIGRMAGVQYGDPRLASYGASTMGLMPNQFMQLSETMQRISPFTEYARTFGIQMPQVNAQSLGALSKQDQLGLGRLAQGHELTWSRAAYSQMTTGESGLPMGLQLNEPSAMMPVNPRSGLQIGQDWGSSIMFQNSMANNYVRRYLNMVPGFSLSGMGDGETSAFAMGNRAYDATGYGVQAAGFDLRRDQVRFGQQWQQAERALQYTAVTGRGGSADESIKSSIFGESGFQGADKFTVNAGTVTIRVGDRAKLVTDTVTGQAITGRGQWQFEDWQRALSRTNQESQFGFQAESLEMGDRQFRERMGQQQNRFSWETNFQREGMGLQWEKMQTQYQWGMEDIAFKGNQQTLGYGWQMQDIDEALRYSTGRERRQLLKRQERETVQYGMSMGRLDTEEDRLGQRREWDEEEFGRQQEYFEKRVEWTQQEMDMSLSHHEEQFDLQQRRFDADRDYFREVNRYQDEMTSRNREMWELEFANATTMINFQNTAQNQQLSLQALQEALNVATVDYMTTFRQEFESGGGLHTATFSFFDMIGEKLAQLLSDAGIDTSLYLPGQNVVEGGAAGSGGGGGGGGPKGI